MRLHPVTWLIVLAAGLSLSADLILWAWVARSTLDSLSTIDGPALSAVSWLRVLGPMVAWRIKISAGTLEMLGAAVLVEGLSRIHRRLRARNAVQFEGGAHGPR